MAISTLLLPRFLALIIGIWTTIGLVDVIGAANQISLAEANRKCQNHPDYGPQYIAQNTKDQDWTCAFDPYHQRVNAGSGCPGDSKEPKPDCPPVCPKPEFPAPVCPTPICPTPVIPTPVCPAPVCPTPVCPGPSNALVCPALNRRTIPMKSGRSFTFFCGTEFQAVQELAYTFEAESIFDCVDIDRLHPKQRNSKGFQYNKRTKLCTPLLQRTETSNATLNADVDSASRVYQGCIELHGSALQVGPFVFRSKCGYQMPDTNLLKNTNDRTVFECMFFLRRTLPNPRNARLIIFSVFLGIASCESDALCQGVNFRMIWPSPCQILSRWVPSEIKKISWWSDEGFPDAYITVHKESRVTVGSVQVDAQNEQD